MTPADSRLIQEIYRREYRSLLQYSREAAPYTSLADRPLRDGILRIVKEERDELDAFGEWMESLRVPRSYLGSFPVAYTDLNFVTVRHLLPKLVAEQQRDTQSLKADAAACSDDASRSAIQRLIELHTRHLKELESLG
jgi:hypothetical protein